MPHISKYKLSREQIGQLSQRIVDAAFSVKRRSDLQSFFNDLLSTTEKIMLGKRLLIAMMLERGSSYFDIRNKLGVSDPTIASISERLQIDGSGFRTVIKRLQAQEDVDLLIENFGKVVAGFFPRMPKINYIPRQKKYPL